MLTIAALAVLLMGGGLHHDPVCLDESAAFQAASREFLDQYDPGAPAERLLDAARRVRACESVGSSLWVDALIGEGEVLVRRGQRADAVRLYSDFLTGHPSAADPRDRARVLLNRAMENLNLDRPLDATRDLLAARSIADPDHLPTQYHIHSELGSAYRTLGAHEEAIAAFRELIRIAQRIGRPEDLAFAHARHADAIADHWSRGSRRDRGRILAAVSEAETAARVINQRVDELGAAAHQDVLFRRTETNMTWYRTLSFAGLHDKGLEVALTIPSLLAAEYIPHETMGQLAVGAALERAGRLDEAYDVLKRAAADPNIETRFVPAVQRLLGGVLVKLGRYEEAEEALLASVESYEASTRVLGASQWASLNFNFAQPALRSLIALYLMQDRAREAFEVLERSRARSVRSARRVIESMGSQSELAGLEDLREELRGVRRDLARQGDVDSLRIRASDLEAEIASWEATIRAEAAIDLGSVQRSLADDGRVIVTYFLQEESPSYAFVLNADTLVAVELPQRVSEVWAAVERSRLQIGGGDAFDVDPAALYDLYSAVFAPLADLIPAGAPVTVIPEGPLLEVPFAMLIDRPGARYQYHEWSYLLYRHAFSYDLAASLDQPTVSHGPRVPVVAYGRTTFSAADIVGGLVDGIPPPLPAVRDELAALRRVLPRGRFELNESATRASFLDHMGDGRIVHVASHVYLAPTRPLFSSILLSPDDESEDGALYLHEIAGRPLSAELVVVSACESGAGELRQGEGLVGLHYAFRSAGAGAIVATLWPVDDRAMTDLMSRFYRELSRGARKDVALQRAQVSFLENREGLTANPFLWAGVMLSGDPGPVSGLGGRITPRHWLFLAIMLITAAFIVGRRTMTTLHIHE
jgi:CHAT domain-containing protein